MALYVAHHLQKVYEVRHNHDIYMIMIQIWAKICMMKEFLVKSQMEVRKGYWNLDDRTSLV
jgi:hypothetical protein